MIIRRLAHQIAVKCSPESDCADTRMHMVALGQHVSLTSGSMIASVVHVATKANHQILSNWLKRTISAATTATSNPGVVFRSIAGNLDRIPFNGV
jgi:hypothetical protein